MPEAPRSLQEEPDGAVGRREWWLALALSLGLALLLQLPYWLAYETAQPGAVFSATIMNADDSQTYFAKMLQGYDGAWLYRIPFSSEEHEAAFLGGLYLALGHLARLLGTSLEFVWHGARLLADVALFLTTYWFVAAYLPERRERLTAYLLALTGSGLGWLLFLINEPYWLGHFPVDFKMAEAHLFFTAMTFPHVALGTALLLISVRCIDLLLSSAPLYSTGKTAALAAVANILLVIAYPFLLYLLLLIAALLWAWRALHERSNALIYAVRTAIVFAPAAPLVLYYALVLQSNPVFAAWDAQAGTPSPPWPHYLLAFGPMLALALLGRRARSKQEDHTVLWCWILAAALLVYAPLGPQRRFVQGVQVPLAVLATVGALRVLWPALCATRPLQRLLRRPRYTMAGMRRLFIAFFLAFMALSNIYVFASVNATAVIQQPYPLFRTADEMAAVRWLRAHSAPEEVVLGDYQTGNLVAARAGNFVVLGHWAETMDYEQKRVDVARFYSAESSDAWRQEFLTRERVTHVWHGPQETTLGAFNPATAPYLHPIAHFPTITLYQVHLP